MNLNKIDLNLFAVFDAIYTAGSLTKAAEILCITQPAVSNSLARLRQLTNDQLFVRAGHKMAPTPIAQNMIVPARQALKLLHTCVQERQTFDPTLSEKVFNFASHDILEASIMPRLVIRLQEVAPNLALTNFDMAGDQVVAAMASGTLDFYAGATAISDPQVRKEIIARDKLVVVAKKEHPKLVDGLDLTAFLSLGHVTVATQKYEKNQVDVALDRLGEKRQVKLSGQHYLTVPSVVVKTDLVACLPYHMAKHYDVALYDLPVDVPAIEYFLHWHVSADQDLAHIWMREQISEVAKSFKLR